MGSEMCIRDRSETAASLTSDISTAGGHYNETIANACLILSSSRLQVNSLFLDLRGKVGILAPLSGQRSRPVAQGVLDHFEDIAELFQTLLGGLSLLTLVLHRSLEIFYRGLNLGVIIW